MRNPLLVFLAFGLVMIIGPFVYGWFLDTHQVFYRDRLPTGVMGEWQPGGRGPKASDCDPLLARAREATPETLRATREFMCTKV
ncbi:hypothetical protein ACE7GA_23475 [Roseomonas sp. CCTCC AB2023176]|uniref:hypothetical protein n=1 Tax=Roseomonas sp. CCTCC AB2023176 TaxID=3342640 RepID=UPI0035DC02ED